jgi:putative transposase
MRPSRARASRRWSPCGKACGRSFWGYAERIAGGLQARHDHDSQYVSDYFQDELTFLGITACRPAFVREPEGSGVAERFIRTPKEQLLWCARSIP